MKAALLAISLHFVWPLVARFKAKKPKLFVRVRGALAKLRAETQLLKARKKGSPQDKACAAAEGARCRMLSKTGSRGEHTRRKAREELLQARRCAPRRVFQAFAKMFSSPWLAQRRASDCTRMPLWHFMLEHKHFWRPGHGHIKFIK